MKVRVCGYERSKVVVVVIPRGGVAPVSRSCVASGCRTRSLKKAKKSANLYTFFYFCYLIYVFISVDLLFIFSFVVHLPFFLFFYLKTKFFFGKCLRRLVMLISSSLLLYCYFSLRRAQYTQHPKNQIKEGDGEGG